LNTRAAYNYKLQRCQKKKGGLQGGGGFQRGARAVQEGTAPLLNFDLKAKVCEYKGFQRGNAEERPQVKMKVGKPRSGHTGEVHCVAHQNKRHYVGGACEHGEATKSEGEGGKPHGRKQIRHALHGLRSWGCGHVGLEG